MKNTQNRIKRIKEKENLQKVMKEMNLQPLTHHLTNKLQIGPKSFVLYLYISEGRSSFRLLIESGDLTKYTGIMKFLYKSFKIITFGGGDITTDKDGRNPIIWFSLRFSFQYKNMGNNCTEILEAWYNVNNKEWSFR